MQSEEDDEDLQDDESMEDEEHSQEDSIEEEPERRPEQMMGVQTRPKRVQSKKQSSLTIVSLRSASG